MSDTPPAPTPPDAPQVQVPRQLELYLAGPRAGPEAVPLRVEDLEAKARAKLTPQAYDWVAGAAGAEDTARANLEAFRRWRILPRMLVDVSRRDLGVTLFGQRYRTPVLLAPVGVQSVVHPDGEVAAAKAAAALGVPFVLSTVSSFSIEQVAGAMGSAPRWFQLYWSKDPELTLSLVRRAERAGYTALVVTLDTAALGWRERNLELAYLPFAQGHGVANYLTDPVFQAGLPAERRTDPRAVAEHFFRVATHLAHTWPDLALIRQNTRLPLLLKGIVHPDDARLALECGADGIIVSNHGGRQVDGAAATLAVLPGILRMVGGRVPVLFDGGIRRGADVFKALALGAKAVLVGRPYLWALAVNGEEGVRQFLLNFLADLDLTFLLCGKAGVADVGRGDLIHGDLVE
jgi:isopentenyl diphosphate isomerase/L-lactate dehydrogenase-like FMN-dependent dehydrogenase